MIHIVEQKKSRSYQSDESRERGGREELDAKCSCRARDRQTTTRTLASLLCVVHLNQGPQQVAIGLRQLSNDLDQSRMTDWEK